MREKVQAALEQVRPALLADGGDVQLIDVKDGVVHAPSAIFVEGTKPKLVSNNEH